MFHFLLIFLKGHGFNYGFFRLLDYVTFRTIMGAMTALLLQLIWGHSFIVFLYRHRFRDTSGDILSLDTSSKRGTPTGGGAIIIFSTLVAVLLWGNLDNLYLLSASSALFYFGIVGWLDDFQKVKFKSSIHGLSQLGKTLLQLLYIFPFALFFVSSLNPIPPEFRTKIWLPFVKTPILDVGAVMFILFLIFTFFSIVNAVNITDGLDGLVSGPSILTVALYGVFAYIIGNKILASHFLFPYFNGCGELALFGGALVGALFGFLWYNTYPAEVFMGDTGSLALGGSMAVMAFMTKQEMLFPIVGGVFVAMIASSLIQEKIGMRLGRRIFLRAPIHHSFIRKGIAEPKVVIRFWIISLLLTLLAALSIKLR